MADSDASLLHGRGGERRKADDVACGIDVRDRGAIVFVYGNMAAIVQGKAGFLQRQAVHGGTTACGEERSISFEDFAALHNQANATCGVLRLDGTLVKPEMHAERGETMAKAIGDFIVEEGKKAIAAVDESDVHAERFEDGSVFAADDAAANHGQTFGDAVHLQKSVGVKGVDVVENDFRRSMRLGAGGDENDVALQTACAIRAGDSNGVSIFKRSLAANQLDFVQLKVFQDAAAFHVHDFSLVVHEVVHGQIFFQRIIDAVEAALLQAGEIKCGFAQGLAGNGAGIDAASAHVRGALEHGDAFAKIGGLGASLFPGGAAANHQ